ncbi:MAG TPA: HAD family hydrolase [Nitrospiraceae bacterium]|nr:HAD family hydrolase [Nitrospiraceae bacterium]
MAKTRNSDSLAFLFDLDGTLVDSVYQHVLAWREATQAAGIELPVWRIHRQIGMSGGLMLNALTRETGRKVSQKDAERIQLVHAEVFANQASSLRVLPGAQALLDTLAAHRVPHAIATSGRRHSARHALNLLTLHRNVPVITRDDVRFAKPDPDLFIAAGKRLKVPMSRCVIIGDSVWDLLAARRAFSLSVGLLSGGYGREELERAGAYRVYQDPADLLRHLDEVGVRL